MEIYFLKSAACLGILFLFYKLLLEKENMHVFKRCYLLSAVILSLIIPFITFTTYTEATSEAALQILEPLSASNSAAPADQTPSLLPAILWTIYGIGVVIFSFIFLKNLNSIILKIRRNPKLQESGVTKVLLQEEVTPHTFWDYIFLNKTRFEQRAIPQEVFEHEQAHARQKHSLDILFLEILQIILWFYPLIYFVKKAVKLNHEFLADHAVLKKGRNRAAYQETLLLFSSNDLQNQLVNPINYSIIKKRFTVMKTKTSKEIVWVKSFLLLPLLAVLVIGFSTKEVLAKEMEYDQNSSEEVNTSEAEGLIIAETINMYVSEAGPLTVNGQTIALEELSQRLNQINTHLTKETRKTLVRVVITAEDKVPMKIISEVEGNLREYGVHHVAFKKANGEEMAASPKHEKAIKEELEKVARMKIRYIDSKQEQEKATQAMLKEYDRLVKHYNSEKNPIIKNEDLQRMNYIYSIMTPQQREKAEERKFRIPAVRAEEKSMGSEKNNSYSFTADTVVFKSGGSEKNNSYRFTADTLILKKDENNRTKRSFKAGNVTFTEEPRRVPSLSDRRFTATSVPAPPVPPAPTTATVPEPPVPPAPENSNIQVPPPPPPPSPVEAVEKWIDEDAEFFYNGKKISGEKALEIVKENEGKNLSVQIEENNSRKTIRISDRKKAKASGPKSSAVKERKYSNPMKRTETIDHLLELAAEGIVFTYLGKEIPVKDAIKHLERKVTLRYSEVNGKKIMRVEDL